MNKRSLTHTKSSSLRLVPGTKYKLLKSFGISKPSQAAVAVDKNGNPQIFVLNTFALLDILSAVDETLVDKLSIQEYHSKKHNPAGWLIDELESRLPLKTDFIASLKDALQEAGREGWFPLMPRHPTR